MKRKFLALLIFSVLLLLGGMARAESPLYLSHTLTSSTEGADSVTLDFVLHIKNTGSAPLYNLTLSYVPLVIMTPEEVSLHIGDIEAGGSRDVPFTLVTPILISQDEFFRHPLFWAGECLDAGGNPVEFPAESHTVPTGGAI